MRALGVSMSDKEKKQLFFAIVSSKTGGGSHLLTVWQHAQTDHLSDLTFDQILQRRKFDTVQLWQ